MPEDALQQWRTKNRWRWYLTAGSFGILLIAGLALLKREQFGLLLGWQALLYLLFALLYRLRNTTGLQQLIFTALVIRLAAAFTTPMLSDDVYRFIWDGQLIAHHHNPLLSTPDSLLPTLKEHTAYFTELHSLLNHSEHYTCYPPLMQLCGWISAVLGGHHIAANIIVLKLLIALADGIAVLLLAKLLRCWKLPVMLVLLYALNPAVIIEGAGNAHFEVMQVSFVLAALYYSTRSRLFPAAVCWGLAIITKLLPLLLLPLWIKKLGWKKGLIFSAASCSVAALSFAPFVSIDFLQGFGQSIGLYFQRFEFNASVYYIARELGWWIKGYNWISFIGPLLLCIFLALYAVLFFTSRTLSNRQFAAKALLVLALYYAFAAIVHPWYIINLLPFAILCGSRYPLVWCGMAFLSYHAYSNAAFAENLWLVAAEYAVVAGAFLYERSRQHLFTPAA